VRVRVSSAVRSTPAMWVSISAWLRRWRSSRSAGGTTVSLATCMGRGGMPSSFSRRRRWLSNVGRRSGRANFNRMEGIKVANAPCSWGALEFDLGATVPDHLQVLREIGETGYVGTELGDWGFMPTDPVALRDVIDRHRLDLVGAFVPVPLVRKEAHGRGVADALRVARLMAEAGYTDAF